MNLSQRIELLTKLGDYLQSDDEAWQLIKDKAYTANPWFLPEFIDRSVTNIATNFLQKNILEQWISSYDVLHNAAGTAKKVGIVMAGNIPLVGFHDFLCVFISGHACLIKASSKDEVLIKHIAAKIIEWEPEAASLINFSELLKHCNAYIATGSNSSAGYFEYYFGKYPNLIRKNKTSVAILTGDESADDLQRLADDVYLYFGMGCRNVTKIYVPDGYDFIPLIETFKRYNYLADHHKYKNNYDYNLALHILNNKFYMSNESLLIVEQENIFSPVSQLHHETYNNLETLYTQLKNIDAIQCIVGKGFVPFGQAQSPAINDYADGVDTMQFLQSL